MSINNFVMLLRVWEKRASNTEGVRETSWVQKAGGPLIFILLNVIAAHSQNLSVGDSIVQDLLGRPCPVLELWPNGQLPPGEVQGQVGPERIRDTNNGKIRITDVINPTITVAVPQGEVNTGIAVVIAPGGGYSYLVIDKEGVDLAKRLNQDGITGILLKYRCPSRPGKENYTAPLQDAQRAMSLIKSRAAEWGLDSSKIGFSGFSAGGHLGAALSANFNTKAYPQVDSLDDISSRPDFALLTYPAYLSNPAPLLTGLEKETAPYLFLNIGDADNTFYPGYLQYVDMLAENGIEHESHVYENATHGYGLNVAPAGTDWPVKAIEMLLNRYSTTPVKKDDHTMPHQTPGRFSPEFINGGLYFTAPGGNIKNGEGKKIYNLAGKSGTL